MTFCYKKVDLPDMLERNETNTQGKTDSGRVVRFEWKLNLIKGHRDILIFQMSILEKIGLLLIIFSYFLYFQFSFKSCEFSYIDGQEQKHQSSQEKLEKEPEHEQKCQWKPSMFHSWKQGFSKSPIRSGSSPARSVTRSAASPFSCCNYFFVLFIVQVRI